MTEQEKRPAPTDGSWKAAELEQHRAIAANPPKFPMAGGSYDRNKDGSLTEMHSETDEATGKTTRVPMAEHRAKLAAAAKAAEAKPAPAPAAPPAAVVAQKKE